jgi:hypothetical protein
VEHGIGGKYLTVENIEAIEKNGECMTVLADGKPVVVGGIYKFWENRGEAWLIFGQSRRQDFFMIFRAVQKFLGSSPLKRIEMVIDYDFKNGHRWAKILGFKKEAEKLKQYRPDGGDVSLYAMVRA